MSRPENDLYLRPSRERIAERLAGETAAAMIPVLPDLPADGPSSPSAGQPGRLAGAGRASTPAPRSWEVILPPGLKLLSLNGREHWGERNRVFQSLKKAAWAMVLNAKVPRLERVTVRVVYEPPDRRPRDPDNLIVKPLVDALVAAKVLPDDNSAHVAWAHAEISPDLHPMGRLRIVITEAPEQDGAA